MNMPHGRGMAIALMAIAMMVAARTQAGDLDPADAPGPTMHTLEEIYQRLILTPTVTHAVPKTGQTILSAIGDDGDLKKGAAWPNPRFTDNGDGTVTDNLTGLVWLKQATAFGLRSWADAMRTCSRLNSGEYGLTDGSVEGDWRLPNVQELQSLIDYGRDNPALCNAAGTGQSTPDDPFFGVDTTLAYWSSTTFAKRTYEAWGVGFEGGSLPTGSKTYTINVWPVRDGP